MRVAAGDYPELKGTTTDVLACGAAQPPGDSRLQLLERNVKVFQTVVPQVLEHTPETVLLVVFNPVDILGMHKLFYPDF